MLFFILVKRALLVFALFPLCLALEPISTTLFISGIVVPAVYKFSHCKFSECCDDTWIKFNHSGLISTLKRSLHGQHLVEKIVPAVLKSHFQRSDPKQALVMSFHGWTGTGKNFVSKFIAEHIYYKGMESEYVHLYIATKHFPHENKVTKYRDQLQQEIQKYSQLCERSLFIFDEVDKMPEGIIDVIKPYIDYYDKVDGIDYRKNIFIFLSNSGSNVIAKVALEFWKDGKKREEITMKHIDPLINKDVFNNDGGLQKSDIIKRSLIDLYIPFLPLEKKHVELCVKDELQSRSQTPDPEIIDTIADQLEYYPENLHLYSASGCKKIRQKVDLYVD